MITIKVKKHKMKVEWGKAMLETPDIFIELDKKIIKDEVIRIDNEIMQLLKTDLKKE